MSEETNRRVHTRAPCQVSVREISGSMSEGRATNISEGGLYLQRLTEDPLLDGATVSLEITLPGYGQVRAEGCVVAPGKEVFYQAAAVTFTKLSRRDALRIRRFVFDRHRKRINGRPLARIAVVPAYAVAA
jgi:c-di-GMP-binding flagellar brake protein YcgR